MYITNNENISVGDWFYYKHFGEKIIDKANKNKDFENLNNPDRFFKKVILTTDPDLIKDGVQAIDEEFINWFIENPECKEVKWSAHPVNPNGNVVGTNEIYPFNDLISNFKIQYKIIIPQTLESKMDDLGHTLEPKEKMYTEKDMKQYAWKCVANFLNNNENKIEPNLVDIIIDRNNDQFEQFKKK